MSVVFPIMVKLDPGNASSGARRVEGDLEKIKQKALDVNRTIRQVFGVFAIRELATGLYKLIDGYTSLQNKLRVVAKDQDNLNGLTNATFKIAQQTRSSWEATATMYQRMALNSRQLGVSQQDLLNFTKSLNQAVIIGGATSTEAAAGLLQLSQGMASGALRGDELRAVLEQLPVVADVIAKKFKVTRGELRALGTAGKISGKDIIEAFREAAPELEKQFGKTIPTIAQSFEMLKNSAMKFFGEAGAGSGLTNALAQAIKFLSDHAETLGKVLIAVGQAVLGLYVVKGAISLFQALFALIAANPLTAFVMLLTTGILLLRQFGDQIDTQIKVWTNVEGVYVTVGDILRVLWDDFKSLISVIGEFLSDAWASLTSAFETGLPGDGIELSLRNVLRFIAGFIGGAIGMFKMFKDHALEIFGGIAVTVGEAFIDVGRAIAKVFEAILNKFVDAFNSFSTTVFGSVANPAGIKKAAEEAMAKGLTGIDLAKYIQDHMGGSKGPQLGKVDLDFKNPLAGAADLTVGLIKQGIDDSKAEATTFMKKMDDWLDSILARARDGAAGRVMNEKNHPVDGIIDTLPGAYDKAKGKEYQDHSNPWAHALSQLDALLKKTNDVREAEMKLEAADKLLGGTFKHSWRDEKGVWHTEMLSILDELEKRGITAGTVLDELREALKKALDPFGAWVDENIDATAAMQGTTREYELNAAVLATINELTEKGVYLTQAQRNEIEKVTKILQDRRRAWELEKALLDRLTTATEKYTESLAALEAVRSKLTPYQYSSEKLNIESEFATANAAANPGDMAAQFDAGWLEARKKIQADMISVATAVNEVITQMFSNLESFILDSVETGKISWDSLAEGMIDALNKVALKILETWLLMQALNLASGGSVGAGTAIMNAGVGMTGSQLDQATAKELEYLNAGSYAGAFAKGGSFLAPGSGGTDSQLVAMHLTPRERVDITPPGFVPAPASAQGGQASAAVAPQMKVSVHNHIDRDELLSAVDTPQGDRAIYNSIRKNRGAIKALLQG